MPGEEERARRWALVLDSQGIPYSLARGPEGLTIVVHPRDAERAGRALAAYEDENPAWELAEDEEDEQAPDTRVAPLVAAGIALLLTAFHLYAGGYASAGLGDPSGRWLAAGSATAERILAGEWWRTVTALTLHADLGHVAANALSLLLFGTLVFQALGAGTGLALLVLAGAGGNALNALVRGPGHSAIGASTALFGAVGVLAGLQFGRERSLRGSRGALTPILAGVALLALLGSSPDSDVLAHLLGFVVGIPLGLAAGRLPRPGTAAQAALLAGSLLLGAVCWALALGRLGT
jgi:membrane associated rhomboid family serine protease